jgi:hypothetical protein
MLYNRHPAGGNPESLIGIMIQPAIALVQNADYSTAPTLLTAELQ